MILRVDNVHKSYILGRTILPVLRGVSLTVERGEFLAITGSSGSGKSTLLHVMSGLDVPQRGQVLFDGKVLFEPEGMRRIPVGREGSFAQAAASRGEGGSEGSRVRVKHPRSALPDDLRMLENRRNRLRNISFGFVFQFYHLLPEFDVLENVLLPNMVGQSMGAWLADRSRTAGRALDLLQRVGLGDRLKHHPNELSGGERQRVAIARALMNDPAVLFADEPTGNLDATTGRDIFSLIKDLNQAGQTTVMVTHDGDLARDADRIAHLTEGRL